MSDSIVADPRWEALDGEGRSQSCSHCQVEQPLDFPSSSQPRFSHGTCIGISLKEHFSFQPAFKPGGKVEAVQLRQVRQVDYTPEFIIEEAWQGDSQRGLRQRPKQLGQGVYEGPLAGIGR